MNNVDAIRLEEFRQFKKEIRGSTEYLIVGIDVAKEKHHAFLGRPRARRCCGGWSLDNDLEGFLKVLERADALGVQHGLGKVVFGMEAHGELSQAPGESI